MGIALGWVRLMLPLNLVRLREALATVPSRPDPSANLGFAAIPATWRLLHPVRRIFPRLLCERDLARRRRWRPRISVQAKSLVGSPPLEERRD